MNCPAAKNVSLLAFFIFRHRGSDVRVGLPVTLADLLRVDTTVPVFVHFRNFGIRVPSKLRGEVDPVVVLISDIHGAILEAAGKLSGRTYRESEIDRAFGDLYAATLEPPSILGMKVGSRDAVVIAPWLLAALGFVFWHRTRRLSPAATEVGEPWLLIGPRGWVESVGALVWALALILSSGSVAVTLHQVAQYTIWGATASVLPAELFILAAVWQVFRLNRPFH